MTFDRDYAAHRVWDSGRQRPKRGRSTNTVPVERPLRRFRPATGTKLTMEVVRGTWRASAAVDAYGGFAVLWDTNSTRWWAALTDFTELDILRLVRACAWLDQHAGLPSSGIGT